MSTKERIFSRIMATFQLKLQLTFCFAWIKIRMIIITDIDLEAEAMAVLKYSRQRESIKNYLCGRSDHPTADMIYTSIRKDFPNISLGTVYRNLSLLVELGEIQKITSDGADRFDARTDHHHHFICRRCGSVMDLEVPVSDPVPQVRELWGEGEIDECRMEFYGICKSCSGMKN